MSIKILIVEDEIMIAEDLYDICENLGYDVIEPAYNAGDALVKLQKCKPDIVLLDINLEDEIDGIEIGEYINSNNKIPIIYLTSYADVETFTKAKKTKPMAYITKPFKKSDIYTNIELAFYNFNVKQLPYGLDLKKINEKINGELSQREFQLLKYIHQGKSNQSISEGLGITLNTVKSHLKKIYLKMEVPSRTAALVKLRSFAES